MFKTQDIDEIMIEITSNCNAMCLDCGRNLDGVKLNPNLKFGHAGNMKLEVFKKVFDPAVLPKLGKIHFDGNFGDSMIHPQSMEFIKHMAENFPGIELEINTNGGYHNTDWWRELGEVTSKAFNEETEIKFGIDGIDNETHDKYRRNVKFDKIIENAKAFIEAGGKASWKFLEFDHNHHQRDEAEKLAKKLGFNKFRVKKTRWREKAIRKATGEEQFIFGNASKKHSKEKYGGIPDTQQAYVDKVKEQLKQFKDFTNECKIECPWLQRLRLQIEYDGRVWQCCHLSGRYGSGTGFANKQYQYYIDKHGTEWNNINNNDLETILNHPYWDDLHDSFDNKTTDKNNPRIVRCAEKCGQGLEELTN
jgi:hypothetical protein